MTKVIEPDPDGAGGGDPCPETSYVYDAAGQVVLITDPLDRRTEYLYDSLGRQIQSRQTGATPGTPTIVDNGDTGYTEVAPTLDPWQDASNGYGTGHRVPPTGGVGYKATWTFTGLSVGTQYKVFAFWPATATYSTQARYTVLHGAAEQPVPVNQQQAPNDQLINGSTWELLMTLTATETDVTVELSDAPPPTAATPPIRLRSAER